MEEEVRWLSLCHGFVVGGGLVGGERRERVMVVWVVEAGDDRVRRERRVKRERREEEEEEDEGEEAMADFSFLLV